MSQWISPETALPKPGQKIAFVVDQGPSATDRYWYDTGALAEDGDWCGVECLFETVLWWLALPELPTESGKEATKVTEEQQYEVLTQQALEAMEVVKD